MRLLVGAERVFLHTRVWAYDMYQHRRWDVSMTLPGRMCTRVHVTCLSVQPCIRRVHHSVSSVEHVGPVSGRPTSPSVPGRGRSWVLRASLHIKC